MGRLIRPLPFKTLSLLSLKRQLSNPFWPPPQKPDVWRISRLLQTGYEVRRLWYYSLLVTALDQIWVQPALRLTGGRFRRGVLSVASGLRNSWAAIKAIANSLVGIRVERWVLSQIFF
jgi:hypothetical protein